VIFLEIWIAGGGFWFIFWRFWDIFGDFDRLWWIELFFICISHCSRAVAL
jgi:hypothetical protein